MASHDAILGDWCWFVMDLVRMRQEVCILAAPPIQYHYIP